MAELLTKAALAKRIGKSLPTLDKLMALPGFPVEANGTHGRGYKLDPVKVEAFLKEQRLDQPTNGKGRIARGDVGAVVPLRPGEQLSSAKAERERLKLRQEMGELVATADVKMAMVDLVAAVGRFLDALPGRVCRAMNLPDGVDREMRRQIDAARAETVRAVDEFFAGVALVEGTHD